LRVSSNISIDVLESPTSAHLLPSNLQQYALQRRTQREDQLRSEGFASANQSAANVLETASDSLDAARGELQGSLVETAVQLALEIAGSLVRKELAAGNYDIASIVRSVLASTTCSSKKMVLRVNPEDADALADVRFRSGTEVQADPTVRRGDIQLETDQGLLVRNIDECLVSIRENLQEAFCS
jgi:flagellar biosynthesis/type III secretory pathway protein FliH